MVPIGVGVYEYCYYIWVVLRCKSCPMEGLLDVLFGMRVGISISNPFMLEGFSYRPKDFLSKEWGGELSK